MRIDNIITELYKLSQNMNWMVVHWVKLYFCQNFLCHEGERARKP